MRAIVTGGLGFIGSNLVDKLVSLNHEVCVIDNHYSGELTRLNSSAVCLYADIQEPLDRCDFEAEVIFHLAGQARIQPSFDIPVHTMSSNVIGTTNVLELARRIKAKVVYAGSSSFYGDPHKNPYALSKWFGEELCLMYNEVFAVPAAIARFFNVYGPRQPMHGQYATVIGIFERQYAAGEPLTVTGTGEQRRDFTHVSDIVDGLISIAQESWNGEVFNLGCGKNYSIKEVAQMFQTEIKYLPARPGEAWETLADISFTREKLNWTPRVDLADYLATSVLSKSSSLSHSLNSSTSHEQPKM